MTPPGVARAKQEADDAADTARTIDRRGWYTAGLKKGDLAQLDAVMRPIDQLSAAGLGALVPRVQPLQQVIDRLAGKAEVIRTFADAWQKTAKSLGEAGSLLGNAVATDTAKWSGNGAERYRERAGEMTEALRGCGSMATAIATAAVAVGEAVADARTQANELLTHLVRQLVSQAGTAKSVQGGLTAGTLAQAMHLISMFSTPIMTMESNVHNTVTSLYSNSGAGRLTLLWQRLGLWFGAQPRNVEHRTPPTLTERGRYGRGGSFIDGNTIKLVPRNPNVPSVTLPNNVGAKGFEVGPAYDLISREHTYDIRKKTDLPFDQAAKLMGDAIAADPVPAGGDLPASPGGTANNAGLGNLVRTYRIDSPDPSKYTDITVNYTIGDEHILQEGYVIRYGEKMPNGNTEIISYGEGNGLVQHPLSPMHLWFGYNWKENHDDIAKAVGERMKAPAQ
jgi:hypothetical protein